MEKKGSMSVKTSPVMTSEPAISLRKVTTSSLQVYFAWALQKGPVCWGRKRLGRREGKNCRSLTSAAGIQDHQGDHSTSHEKQQNRQTDGHKAPGFFPRFRWFFYNIHLTFWFPHYCNSKTGWGEGEKKLITQLAQQESKMHSWSGREEDIGCH